MNVGHRLLYNAGSAAIARGQLSYEVNSESAALLSAFGVRLVFLR